MAGEKGFGPRGGITAIAGAPHVGVLPIDVPAQPAADPRAAIAGSLYFAAPAVTLAGRTLPARAAETARTSTVPPVLGAALRAWQSVMTAAQPAAPAP